MALLKGKFIKDIYRDFKTGFAIFSLYLGTLPNGKWNTVLVKSQDTIEYRPKTPLVIEGYYEGDSFTATTITECASKDSDIVQYLMSSGCPGIGERTAERIAMTMPDFFNEIRQPDAVQKLKSCGVKDTELAVSILNKDNSQTELIHYLKAHGGTYHQAMKLYAKHNSRSMDMLKADPYRIADEIGLSLDTADSIANEQGKSSFADETRVSHLINMTAEKLFMQEGNTFVPAERFIASVQKCSSAVFSESVPVMAIEMGIAKSRTVSGEDRGLIKSRKLDQAERVIAQELIRLCTNAEPVVDWNMVAEIEKENGFKYAPQQKQAFTLASGQGVKILTGGPGTGKTTTVDGIIRYFEKQFMKQNNGKKPEVKLCAPTGRAAQRIKEQTNRDSSTIHQLLEFKPYGDTEICRGKENPIEADLIVVDEMSMTDVTLFAMFLNAVKTGATVILVGDIDQLASVGPGNVLQDLIDSHKLNVVMLTDVYRQAADSNIVGNAHRINAGDIRLITGEDFEILYTGSDEETAQVIREQVVKYHRTDDKYYTQLLCPTHKGISGVDESNKSLQELLNDTKEKFVYGGKRFHIGDKVIMMKNKFAKGYCNGDVGEIIDILKDKKKGVVVKIGEQEIEVTGESLDDMELSYSMTIHKSQGSEYPVAIVAMTDTSPVMLKKNLLYTAVTRAKKKAVVVDQRGAMEDAIVTEGTGIRLTGLKNKMSCIEKKRV